MILAAQIGGIIALSVAVLIVLWIIYELVRDWFKGGHQGPGVE